MLLSFMYKQYILVWEYEYYKDFSWKTESNTSDPHVNLQNNTEMHVFQNIQLHLQQGLFKPKSFFKQDPIRFFPGGWWNKL